jgi:mono/diheme cytochrome c family protein/uncharacterized membrane protein
MLDSPFFGVLGRVHLVMLHLPIGVMIALLVVEVIGRVRKKESPREVRLVLVWLGALCAVVTAVAGLQLSRESAYSHDGVFLHQWLGISVAVLAVVCALLAQVGKVGAYLGALVLCNVVLVPAGHVGAGITHGDGFLTEPLAPKKKPAPAPVRGAEPPARVEGGGGAETPARGGSSPIAGIDPAVGTIFQKNCVGCHNATKLKGGLALDTAEGLANGGDGGAVVTAGKPDSSEMIMRFKLTPGDKEHMPPPGRTALTAEQVETIRKWIESGGEGVPKGS